MAKTNDPWAREQVLEEAEALLVAKYGGGRDWIDPVRVMGVVRAAASGYGAFDGQEKPEVPADDVLAALTRFDEARAALDRLERDLTRAARTRGASWQQVADSLGLASRTSAESRFVRLERDASTYHGDRYPKRQRTERARDRAGAAWCRANEPRLRAAVWNLACLNDAWPQLARAVPNEKLVSWHRELDGPALGVRLKALRPVLETYGAKLPAGAAAADTRDEVLALLDELHAARHSTDLPDSGPG